MQYIYFNGLDGQRGSYARAPVRISEIAKQLRQRAIFKLKRAAGSERQARLVRWVHRPQTLHNKLPQTGLSEPLSDACCDNLAKAGWAVVFPDTGYEAVREALSPLLELRKAQCGNKYREFKYRANQLSFEFIDEQNHSLEAFNEEVPYYLLLVGSPSEIPFLTQYGIDIEHAVGRIYFEDLADYHAYAERVIAQESRSPRQLKACFFGPEHTDDPLSKLSTHFLVRQLSQKVRNTFQTSQVRVQTWHQGIATKKVLLNLMGGADTPDLLMVAAHGLTFYRSNRQQRELQGALVCDDWPGPKRWSGKVPTRFCMSGQDLDETRDLEGMTAFIFSCFSAGVPLRDNLDYTSTKPYQYTDQPFLTQLPIQMLRRGCTGIVGHVDSAYPWSYVDDKRHSRTEVFEAFFKAYLDGKTLGHAMSIFQREYTINLARFYEIYQSQQDGYQLEDIQLVQFWLSINDLRNYILLGDPAIRLYPKP